MLEIKNGMKGLFWMTGKIIGITTTDEKGLTEVTKHDLLLQGGHSANICYTKKNWDQVVSEPLEDTENRINDNKENNHHSVFGHSHVSVYFEGMPKLLAMLMNNEKEYNTSEKSARYTKMKPREQELILYTKWISLLENKIKQAYPNENYLSDKTIHKLALENARYLISVFTPTNMVYTTSERQWNYLYDFAGKMLEEPSDNRLINGLKPSLEEFRKVLEGLDILDKDIVDYRNRRFSLISDDVDYKEHFGRSYSVNYELSFAGVAQAQRHRSLDYQIEDSLDAFYVPPIIWNDENLKNEWLKDISSVRDFVPQGTLLWVNETGKYEDFKLKLQERLCTHAQLEICESSRMILEKYVNSLKEEKDRRNEKILSALEPCLTGARCTFGYKCTNPCNFKEGISLTRKI